MEVSLYHNTNTRNMCSLLPLGKIKHHARFQCESRRGWWNVPETQSGLRLRSEVGKWGLAVRCAAAAQGPLAEIERELEAIEINPEKEEWMSAITRSNKCGERRGLVDLLECLESEAIMGEDQGIEPTDYNRRAQIFDSSSRVFQALKEKEKHTHPHVIKI